MSEGAKAGRRCLDVTQEVRDDLDAIAGMLRAASISEANRRSVAFVRGMLERRQAGERLLTRAPDGTYTEVVVL